MIPALPLVGKILVDLVASGASAVLSPQDSDVKKVGAPPSPATSPRPSTISSAPPQRERTARTAPRKLGAPSASWPSYGGGRGRPPL